MTYRQPGVKVTQVFLATQPALAALALPNVAVGPAYQLVDNDLLGTYSGNLQVYTYASLAAGGVIDLEKALLGEVYPITKKPISLLIANAVVEMKASAGTGYVANADLRSFKDDTALAFQDVQAGDKIRVVESTGLTIVSAQTNGVSTTANPNRLTEGSAGDFNNVKTGDSVVVTGGTNTNTGTYTVDAKIPGGTLILSGNVNDGGGASSDVAFSITGDRGTINQGVYRVKSKISNNELELESPLFEEEAPITYSAVRDVSSIPIPRVDTLPNPGFLAEESGITLPAGLQYAVGLGSFDIIEGSVKASYRGLRTDLASQIRDFSDIAELYALYGNASQIHPQNPLGFAASIALSNAVTPTNTLGLSATFATSESLAYLEAYDVLEQKEMYAISVLTQNGVIHQSLKTHVEQLSQPDNKLERVGLFNSKLVTEETLQDQSVTYDTIPGSRIIVNTQVDGEADIANPTWLDDATTDAFLNVRSGDSVTIVGGTNSTPGVYTVVSKTNNNRLVLSGNIITSGISADFQYFINRKDGISAEGTNLYDRNANYISDGIAAGDIIRVTAASSSFAEGDHKVTAVISNKELQVAQIPGITSLVTVVEYEVIRELTKTAQAEAIKGYSESIGSRRMVHVWPDVLEASVGNSLEKVPGFYGCVAVGALITGLPSQQGFTNLSLSGFLGLDHSSGYFKDSQLNIIADGGTFILAQEAAGQALYIRHQLTTDRSAILFQELSLTKNVDFAAKFLRNGYKKFIGKYNIVDTTLDEMKQTGKGLLKFLKEDTRLPKIGGIIRGGSLTKLVEDDSQIDTVKATFRCNFPVPLNNVDITLEVE